MAHLETKQSMMIFLLLILPALASADFAWSYKCNANQVCERVPLTETDSVYNPLPKCRLECKTGGTLWPYPTGTVDIKGALKVQPANFILHPVREDRTREAFALFQSRFAKHTGPSDAKVTVIFQIANEISELDMATDESYRLIVQEFGGAANVVITAQTFQVC